MKFIGILSLSLMLLSSCVEREIEAYDSLSPTEQEEIRNRGRAQCLSRLDSTYAEFKRASNEVFSSTGYNRGKGFTAEFAGGTVKKTLEVQIWKRTSEALYFYITSENDDDYFLKISKAENELMVDAMLDAHCLRPEIYNSNINSNVLSMTNEYVLPKSGNREKYIDTYRMEFSSLVQFANYRVNRTRATFNDKDEQIDTTVKYQSTMKGKDYTFSSTNYQANEYNQKFCVVDNSFDYRFPKERGVEGFKYLCVEGAAPVDWDLSI